MCSHIKDIINNSECKEFDHELNNNMEDLLIKCITPIKIKILMKII